MNSTTTVIRENFVVLLFSVISIYIIYSYNITFTSIIFYALSFIGLTALFFIGAVVMSAIANSSIIDEKKALEKEVNKLSKENQSLKIISELLTKENNKIKHAVVAEEVTNNQNTETIASTGRDFIHHLSTQPMSINE